MPDEGIQKLPEKQVKEKVEKPEKEHKEKVEKLEKEHKEKVEKLEKEHKEKLEKESKEHKEKLEKEHVKEHIKETIKESIKEAAKEIEKVNIKAEHEVAGPGPVGPGDPVEQRLSALEAGMAQLRAHFIQASDRPDLSTGALGNETDAS